MYGLDFLLPVDFTAASWRMLDWDEIKRREDFLAARMRRLDERELVEACAVAELERSLQINENYFDRAYRIRLENRRLVVGGLALL
jgi:hypothetical protein